MLKYLFGLFFVWGMNLEKFFQMILFFLCFVFFVEVLNIERLDGFMFDRVSLIIIVLVF